MDDLSFLRGKASKTRAGASGPHLLPAAAGSNGAVDDSTAAAQLPFSSRLSRAPRTGQPAADTSVDGVVSDTEDPFGEDELYLDPQPDRDEPYVDPYLEGTLPRNAEGPDEALGPHSRQLSRSQQPVEGPHGSHRAFRAADAGASDSHHSDSLDSDEAAPRRRPLKRLRRVSEGPGGVAGRGAAVGSRSLADWTGDDEEPGSQERQQMAAAAAPKGSNPFARAAKGQSQVCVSSADLGDQGCVF